MRLRRATPDDHGLLRHWDQQPHVIASDPNDDWNWETELSRSPDWREQLIAEVDGRPIGFVQIIDPAREETHYWSCTKPGRRAIDIWIGEESDLGRGYGTQMMRLAIERLGFEYVVQRRFGEDSCFVYRLARPPVPAANT